MKNILQKGFTLLEVLIAVAILGVIMTLIWSSSSQSFRAKERTELRDSVFQNGRVVLRKISDDLAVAFLSKKVAGEGAGSEQAAFTSGAKTFFIGDDQGAQDLLKFTSLSHMRLYKQAKECDQVKISYEVVPSDEPGVYNLIRRADPWLDNTTDVKGSHSFLSRNKGIQPRVLPSCQARVDEDMEQRDGGLEYEVAHGCEDRDCVSGSGR